MQKIISLFQRNYETDRLVRDEVTPGAEWVIAGEGSATRKWDGTCCLVRGGKLFKRYEVKKGGTPPTGFEPAGEVDPVTLKQQGWLPVGDGPEDRWHREAWDKWIRESKQLIGEASPPLDGTYELVGPKIQGNPEELSCHQLLTHGLLDLDRLYGYVIPRNFGGLRDFFLGHDIEGIVWHHPDGRMVKIKAKDFGIKRGR